MATIKAIIYARVSSKEQEETGYSLDAQEKLLKEHAQKKNLAISKVFRVSESASGRHIRKTFDEMLRHTNKYKIPVILCEKIDRLTRNLKDAASVSDWIQENDSREVHFVKESFIVNKNTRAHENLVWDMKVAIARFYTNNLSEEVKKGQKEKIGQGWLPTVPPIGYKTVGEKGHKIHIIDEEMAPLVRKMFELYATGNYSLKALSEKLHKEGLQSRGSKKVGKSRMHETMRDPFFYGKIRWKGELYEGKHKPIISKELFNNVQSILSRGGKNPQYKKHLSTFKSKIHCGECGGTISWELQKGHWYGSCKHYKPCSQKGFIRQEKIEEQLLPHFDQIKIKNKRILEWIEKALKETHSEEIAYNNSKRKSLNQIILNAEKRVESAYKDKLDGKMPSELCEKIIKESMEEKEGALKQLKNIAKERTKYYMTGIAIHNLASNASKIYQSPETTIEEKRLLLSHIFSNLTLKDRKIEVKYTLAFEFLAEWAPKLNATFEPRENLSIKGKRDAFTSPCPVLLRGSDSNRRPSD